MKRCICISILGFNLDERPEYHRIYRLRDETGHEFSDMLEIHVIELNKTLSGSDRMDEWIRLFNAQTEEELKMLEARTKNPGIIEAIREVRIMRLGRIFKALHDARMKEIRDRNARDDYVRMEGHTAGLAEGKSLHIIKLVQMKLQKGKTSEVIAEELEESLENVERICAAVSKCGMEADAMEIFEEMQK